MDIAYYKKYEPLFGSWHIVNEIGEGSFGKVFEIERRELGHVYKAAVKAISVPQSKHEIDNIRAICGDEQSAAEYYRDFMGKMAAEFELMSKLKGHSNIVSYEDHAVYPQDNGIGWDIFIRMELLTPLSKHIVNRAMSEQDVVKLGIDICKALETCRKHSIVHRDIKPENIFVSENGDFKLGDFGIAKTMDKTIGGLSQKGTYTYMAPEIYKGQAYGPSVDIYSLGIVLYRYLNKSRAPFYPDYPTPVKLSDGEAALAKRMNGEPVPALKGVPSVLSDAVMKACAFNSEDRYSSPTEMREALEAAAKAMAAGPEKAAGNANYFEKTTSVFNADRTVTTAQEATVAEFAAASAQKPAVPKTSPLKQNPAPNYGGRPVQQNPNPNYGGRPVQQNPNPNYGGRPVQQNPNPNYGGRPVQQVQYQQGRSAAGAKPSGNPRGGTPGGTDSAKEEKKYNTWLYISIAAFIIAAAILLFYFHPWDPSGGTTTGTYSPETNPTETTYPSEDPDDDYHTSIVDITAGYYHTVGLLPDGSVVAIGYNGTGQCNVSGWRNIVDVSAGGDHTVGLKSNGTVVATGNNEFGQCNVSGWSDIEAVAGGYNHTVGLRSDGTVVATGDNEYGQCDVSGWRNIIAVSAGGYHTLGLRSDGTVVATGRNDNGQCDVSGWRNIVEICAGGYHSVALRSNGTVVAVGNNECGQCNVSGWSGIEEIGVGFYHTVGLKSSGNVLATGSTKDGRCDVYNWSDISHLCVGGYHTIGITYGGYVYTVGYNEEGECNISDWKLVN